MVPSWISAAHWAASALRYSPNLVLELNRFPRRSPADQRRLIAERLLERVQYFGRRDDALPEWREAARIRDADVLFREYSSLPIVNKRMLCERFEPRQMAQRFGLRGRVGSTGGSTGEPTQFFHDTPMLAAGEAKALYVRWQLGWRPGMATVCVWGSDLDIGRSVSRKSQVLAAMRRDLVVSGYRLNEETARRYVALVRENAPVVSYGFTSMLTHVARLAIDLGLSVPPGSIRTAWNGGEVLTQDQSDLFRQAFGVPLHNLYGGRELSTIACQFREDGPIEILRPLTFVELVDDAGRPAAPGTAGRLLLTSTVCGGTPFLRYEIGDCAIADPDNVDESGIRALKQLVGRQSGILRLADGSVVQNLFWNHLLKEYREVHQFQVVVTDSGIELKLRGPGLRAETEEELKQSLARLLGSTPVSIRWVPEIERTKAGKLLQVVDRRTPK